jgi:hypothetical protein
VKSDIRMAAVYTLVERFEKAVDRSGLFVRGRLPLAILARVSKGQASSLALTRFLGREPLSALLQNAPNRVTFYARLPLADRLSDVVG